MVKIPESVYDEIKALNEKLKNYEEIWIECTCDYVGFADMVKFEGMKYKHPTCPNCGEMISEIIEIPHNKWIEKINS